MFGCLGGFFVGFFGSICIFFLFVCLLVFGFGLVLFVSLGFFWFLFVLIKGKSANLLGIVVRRETPFEVWGWGGFDVYPRNASFMFSPERFHSRNRIPAGFGVGYWALLCCCCFTLRCQGSCGVGKGKIGSCKFRPH